MTPSHPPPQPKTAGNRSKRAGCRTRKSPPVGAATPVGTRAQAKLGDDHPELAEEVGGALAPSPTGLSVAGRLHQPRDEGALSLRV